MDLPSDLSDAEFQLSRRPDSPLAQQLLRAATHLARHHRLAGEVEMLPGGSNFLVSVGPWNVIKLFPPFQRFQGEAESRVLKSLLSTRLPVVVPEFRAAGSFAGWFYVAMSRLEGTPLETLPWQNFSLSDRAGLLEAIGEVMRCLHSLPPAGLPALDPPWELFWEHQRSHCLSRQRRTGLPEHLLARLPAWIAERIPELPVFGAGSLLTGEYTPENLLLRQIQGRWRLTAMLDFGDSMLGAPRYDWVGPLCFLVQGQRPLLEAFLRGYAAQPGVGGLPPEEVLRQEALNHLLLHRYSCLRQQLRLPGWQTAASFEELADRIWPAA